MDETRNDYFKWLYTREEDGEDWEEHSTAITQYNESRDSQTTTLSGPEGARQESLAIDSFFESLAETVETEDVYTLFSSPNDWTLDGEQHVSREETTRSSAYRSSHTTDKNGLASGGQFSFAGQEQTTILHSDVFPHTHRSSAHFETDIFHEEVWDHENHRFVSAFQESGSYYDRPLAAGGAQRVQQGSYQRSEDVVNGWDQGEFNNIVIRPYNSNDVVEDETGYSRLGSEESHVSTVGHYDEQAQDQTQARSSSYHDTQLEWANEKYTNLNWNDWWRKRKDTTIEVPEQGEPTGTVDDGFWSNWHIAWEISEYGWIPAGYYADDPPPENLFASQAPPENQPTTTSGPSAPAETLSPTPASVTPETIELPKYTYLAQVAEPPQEQPARRSRFDLHREMLGNEPGIGARREQFGNEIKAPLEATATVSAELAFGPILSQIRIWFGFDPTQKNQAVAPEARVQEGVLVYGTLAVGAVVSSFKALKGLLGKADEVAEAATDANKLGKVDDAAQAGNFAKPKVASVGTAAIKDYRVTFFAKYPELKGKVVIHHAVPQRILDKFRNLFTWQEIHSLENLRGIPKSINSETHLRDIAKRWNEFIKNNPNPTRQQILDFATTVDNEFGHLFTPPVR